MNTIRAEDVVNLKLDWRKIRTEKEFSSDLKKINYKIQSDENIKSEKRYIISDPLSKDSMYEIAYYYELFGYTVERMKESNQLRISW